MIIYKKIVTVILSYLELKPIISQLINIMISSYHFYDVLHSFIYLSIISGPEPTIIRYKDNEIYRYRVEALSSIHTLNTLKEEHTKLTYSAFFDIAPENKCSFLLRVSNVEVIGLDGKVICLFMNAKKRFIEINDCSTFVQLKFGFCFQDSF